MKKAQVFLREKQEYMEKLINPDFSELVDEEMLQKWQKMINLVADIYDVKAGLIMRITEENMEVFLRSENEDNPYPKDGKDHLGHGLYCETVIGENGKLSVENSLNTDIWKDNPDVQLDMISYLGLPIKNPDDTYFGTICVLDNKTMKYSQKYHDLLEEFCSSIEKDLKFLKDIAERNQAGEALRVSEARYRSLTEDSHDLICRWLPDTTLTYVNQAYCNYFGKKSEELLGESWIKLLPEDTQDEVREIVSLLVSKPRKLEYEHKAVDKDGKEKWVAWWDNPVYDDNGILMEFHSSGRDITERKQTEEELKASRKIIEEAYSLLEEEINKAAKIHQRLLPTEIPKQKLFP